MEVKRREERSGAVTGRIATSDRKYSPVPPFSVKSHKNPFPHLLNIVFFNLFKSPLDVI